MESTTTQNLEHISLGGPIGLAAAIALGIAMVVLCGVLLWREKAILGRRKAVLFWTLRAVALATVLWMLLAPQQVKTQTSTTRRAVVVITDVSGSMQTVDPPGSADELRWALSNATDTSYVTTRSADQAVVAVGTARQSIALANEALNQHKPESLVVESTTLAEKAIQRAKTHLDAVASTSDVNTRKAARKLIESLNAPELQAFSRLSAALQKGRVPSEMGWRESLLDLQHRVAGLTRPLRELARLAAQDELAQVARSDAALLTNVRKSSRLGLAAGFVQSLRQSALESVEEQADVRFSSFDRTVKLLPKQATPGAALRQFAVKQDGESKLVLATDVSAVLEELNRQQQEQPLAAVFLLTDVAHNQASEANPRDVAATLGDTPVYVVPIGNSHYQRDVVLQSVSAPVVAMRNDDIVIEARLQAHECEGELCTVQLMSDGRVLDFREVVLDSDFVSRTVRFEKKMPTIGVERMQVVVAPLGEELTDENNVQEIEVNVTRSDIKVLLADDYPRWEYRYLAQLFRRDPKVECDELLFHPRMIATGRRAETSTFPITVDEWDQYDVVMLGDLPVEKLPVAAQESLVEYLQQRGGTVVMIAGHEAMPSAYAGYPLYDVLPVERMDVPDDNLYSFQVTEEGRDHHALMIGESDDATRLAWDFVNRFSPLHWVSPWRKPRPSAHALIAAVPRGGATPANADAGAFLCWQAIGSGRVVYLSGPDSYRLRLLRGDRLHYRFWGQLLRWAIASELSVGSKFVRVRADKSRYQAGEDVHVTVRLTDSEGLPITSDGVQLAVSTEAEHRIVPLTANDQLSGEYLATMRSLPPGDYRVEPVGVAVESLRQASTDDPVFAEFSIQPEVAMELIDTRCDRALARQIADMTGGQVVPPTAVEEVLALTNLEPIVDEKIETKPMWLQWKYLWLVFGCLQIEWVVRKWLGLS